DIARQPSQRPLKRAELHNLRADMHADSPPLHIPRTAVCQVQASRVLPIQSKLVLVAARRDVRMAAGLYIWIHADRYRWHRRAAPPLPRGLFRQRRKLLFRLNIEKQNAPRTAASGRTITQR